MRTGSATGLGSTEIALHPTLAPHLAPSHLSVPSQCSAPPKNTLAPHLCSSQISQVRAPPEPLSPDLVANLMWGAKRPTQHKTLHPRLNEEEKNLRNHAHSILIATACPCYWDQAVMYAKLGRLKGMVLFR